jgi:hypothetical protein
MHQVKFLLPTVHECLTESGMFRVAQVGIPGHQCEGLATSCGQDALVAEEMGHPQLGEPRLARAQELPWAADFQIAFSDHETVAVLYQCL